MLCIHGFTGTPFEMRYLGERLHEHGFTVLGPVLPGHCTSPEQLDQTTWQDWYSAVEDAFDELRRRCRRVAVVGQSLGGLLGLHLARERGAQLCALAALATPIWWPSVVRSLLDLYRRTRLARALPNIPKLGGGSDVRDPDSKRHNPSYSVIPVRALFQLDEIAQLVRAELGEVRVPTQLVHARQDHTAPFGCADEIARRLGGPAAQRIALEGSYHLVSLDIERAFVATQVGRFLESQFRAAH